MTMLDLSEISEVALAIVSTKRRMSLGGAGPNNIGEDHGQEGHDLGSKQRGEHWGEMVLRVMIQVNRGLYTLGNEVTEDAWQRRALRQSGDRDKAGWPKYQPPLSCATLVVRTGNLFQLPNRNYTDGGPRQERRSPRKLFEGAPPADFQHSPAGSLGKFFQQGLSAAVPLVDVQHVAIVAL